MRTKITKRFIDAVLLVQPGELSKNGKKVVQHVYWDTELRGFGLVVGSVAKSFIVQRDKRYTIGGYPVLTVVEARREARKLLGKMALGHDPVKERRAARDRGMTLQEAWDLYRTHCENLERAASTLAGYDKMLNTYLPTWLKKPLGEITRRMVSERHREIGERAPYAANGTMRVLRAVWRRARKQHPEMPETPTDNVSWYREHRRDSALHPPQIARWYRAVMKIENPIRRDYLRGVLFTGLRRESAACLRWEHVDFDQRTLFVATAKGGRAFHLPLPDFLVEMLRARQVENATAYEKSPWVFPAASATGHISEPKERLTDPDDAEDAPKALDVKWNVHALRNTFATVAEHEVGTSAYTLKRLLNHRTQDVTAGYVNPSVEQLRPAMQAIAARLLAICEGGATVTTLPAVGQGARL